LTVTEFKTNIIYNIIISKKIPCKDYTAYSELSSSCHCEPLKVAWQSLLLTIIYILRLLRRFAPRNDNLNLFHRNDKIILSFQRAKYQKC